MRVSLSARLRDDRGAVAVMVAILSVVLVGMSAFVVDFGVAYASKRQLSTAADAAALAAANRLAQGDGTCSQIVSAGSSDAEAIADEYISGPNATIGDASVVPGSFSVQCSPDNSFIDVTLDATAGNPTFFGGVFGAGIDQVSRSATARVGTITEPGGLRPYALCAADAFAIRAASRDADPDNDVLVVKLENKTSGGNPSILPRTANPENTNLTLTANPTTGVTTATPVTFTAELRAKNKNGPAIPSVSVTFRESGVLIGTATTDAAGIATFTSTLNAGARTILASFAPPNDDSFKNSDATVLINVAVVTPPPTTAPPTTAPPTTAPPVTEPPAVDGDCGPEPGNFGQLDFAAFPGEDECEEAFNQKSFIFACYISDGYNEFLGLPATIQSDTGNNCDIKCEEAWNSLKERQISLPVYTAATKTEYTTPYVIGVRVCGYWFGTNTNWASPTCGRPWSSIDPEPKNVDTQFQFRFERLVGAGNVGQSGCAFGDDCDLLRGLALAPGPGGKS